MQFGQGFPEVWFLGSELNGPLEPVQRIGQLSLAAQDQSHVGMGLCQVGLNPERLEVGGSCFEGAVESSQCVSQVVMKRGDVGLPGHRGAAVHERLLGHPAVEENLPQVGMSRGIGRIQLDRCAKMHERLVDLARLAEGDTQVVMRRSEIRPILEGAAEGVDGLGSPAQGLKCQAEVGESFGEIRLQLDRGPATANGSIESAQGSISFGQVGMEAGHVGTKGDRAANQVDGPRMITLLMLQDSKKMERQGVRLIGRQDPLVELGRLRKPSCLMEFDGIGRVASAYIQPSCLEEWLLSPWTHDAGFQRGHLKWSVRRDISIVARIYMKSQCHTQSTPLARLAIKHPKFVSFWQSEVISGIAPCAALRPSINALR